MIDLDRLDIGEAASWSASVLRGNSRARYGLLEEEPNLGLRGAPVLPGPFPKNVAHSIVQIANSQRGHVQMLASCFHFVFLLRLGAEKGQEVVPLTDLVWVHRERFASRSQPVPKQ